MPRKKILKLIICIILMIFSLFLLTGCGKLKNPRKIKNYLKEKYNIDVEIVSVEEGDDYKSYTVKEKNRDITFTCTSQMMAVGMDGSTFWHQESTSDNYYAGLTYSIQDDIARISRKYNVEFKLGRSGLIEDVVIYVSNEKNIDFNTLQNAINELMISYNLKKEPSANKITGIFVYIADGTDTDYYYKYTAYGKKTELLNAKEEFSKEHDIPEQLEQDALNYMNNLYDGNCYITDTNIVPMYQEEWIAYIIVNDNLKFKQEIRINLDKYRDDLNNNKLEKIENYIETIIEYVY